VHSITLENCNKRLIIFIIYFPATPTPSVSHLMNIPDMQLGRIVGGNDAVTGAYPHQVDMLRFCIGIFFVLFWGVEELCTYHYESFEKFSNCQVWLWTKQWNIEFAKNRFA